MHSKPNYKRGKPKIQSGHFLLLFNSNRKCPDWTVDWIQNGFWTAKNDSDLLYHLAKFGGDRISHASARREGL